MVLTNLFQEVHCSTHFAGRSRCKFPIKNANSLSGFSTFSTFSTIHLPDYLETTVLKAAKLTRNV